MSNFQIFNIAGQGMSAQTSRLNTTASNMANAESISDSEEKTYRARSPVFAAIQAQVNANFNDSDISSTAGVQMLGVVESNAPIRKQYHPENPMANKEGYIFLPNVNMVQEMSNMISASRSYAANVDIMTTAKNLIQKTLTLGE